MSWSLFLPKKAFIVTIKIRPVSVCARSFPAFTGLTRSFLNWDDENNTRTDAGASKGCEPSARALFSSNRSIRALSGRVARASIHRALCNYRNASISVILCLHFDKRRVFISPSAEYHYFCVVFLFLCYFGFPVDLRFYRKRVVWRNGEQHKELN